VLCVRLILVCAILEMVVAQFEVENAVVVGNLYAQFAAVDSVEQERPMSLGSMLNLALVPHYWRSC